MLTILEGDPGLGKSFLAMHISARVSTGGSLPGDKTLEPGSVLYMSAEDDPGYTIRPRIEAMGGDPAQVRFAARPLSFDDDGLRLLRREIAESTPQLIVIDPIYGFVPVGSNMYRPNKIRALLSELSRRAAGCDAAMVAIRHLTKAKSGNAIYQGVGAIDVIAAARSAILVAPHPEHEDQRVVAHVKHNLSARADSLVFDLTAADGGLPTLRWRGTTALTAEDLRNPGKRTSAGEGAADFLRRELCTGRKSAQEMLALATGQGIAKRTLDRAKKELGVRSEKGGDVWFWELPASH
jgi:hypothetical protein